MASTPTLQGAASVAARRRAPIGADPLGAIERGELGLCYQPIVVTGSRRIVGFEALLRWRRPDGCHHDTEAFIAALERGPHVDALDRWILTTACCAASRWPDPIQVSVNVTPRRLGSPDLLATIDEALRASGLPGHRLCLEVVERSPILCHPAVTRNVRRLRALGIALALDDFLVHYSSLASLDAVPVDLVKLDRHFVAPLNRGEPAPIAEAIAALADALGLVVVAEGIETGAGEAAAASLGCRMAQGFLYSPAVPAGETDRLVSELGSTCIPEHDASIRSAEPTSSRPARRRAAR